MSQAHLSEQELVRREKLAKLVEAGIDPFPAPLYPVTHYSTDIKDHFTEETKEQFASVCVAGRIMSINDKGKVFFIKIQDSKGLIQLYVKRDDLYPGEDKSLWDTLVKHGLDLGDIIGATGYVFITKTGETSIHAQTLTLLTKSLKPLPVVKRDEEGHVFDAVTDPEFRYRQRYADLIINPTVKDTFVKRTRLINTIREFLNAQGALEVDTPVLQSIPGGAAARPFVTHHNALDIPFYLRIANELYLKPYKDYFWMMEITEQLFEKIAIALHGTTDVPLGDQVIHFKAPFKRISIYDAIKENTGIDVSEMDEAGLREVCKRLHIDVPGNIAMFIDHDFLRALEYGMPPTSGIGIGIDRLCMMMTNQVSIQDVLLFPQMRPESI
eukprot:jgi/Mesen1/3428/ME001927S02646